MKPVSVGLHLLIALLYEQVTKRVANIIDRHCM